MKKSVLITGCSTGIGYELAKAYLAKGYDVFGTVRKEADAERLQEELKGIIPLLFDVSDEAAIVAAAKIVEEKLGGRYLNILINNAGIAISGPLMLIEMEEMRRQFEINVFGLLRVTQVFLPLLGAVEKQLHPPGKIINISSVAGQLAFPFLGPYAASKHALEGLSHSLRRELLPHGIDVVIIGPAGIKTPIWEKESANEFPPEVVNSIFGRAAKRVQKMLLKNAKIGMEPDDLANRILKVSEKKRPKIRYAFAKNYWMEWFIPRYLMSARKFDGFIKKRTTFRN